MFCAKRSAIAGLIVSDDLEMGGVLKAAPIEQAAVEHIRAGGDLCLICHIEEYVIAFLRRRCLERRSAMPKFARRAKESVARVLRVQEEVAKS